mgnify:CR=1 FL=1
MLHVAKIRIFCSFLKKRRLNLRCPDWDVPIPAVHPRTEMQEHGANKAGSGLSVGII